MVLVYLSEMSKHRSILYKDISVGALDVDTSGRKVKVAIAEFGTKDRDGDIIVPSAVTKSIAERGPNGTNEIWHLIDHMPSLKSALGKFSEMGSDSKYLWGVSEYKDSFVWREVAWPLYEKGDITQHSFGFSIVNQKRYDTHNEITEVQVWEGSAVLWGANPNTPTLEVSKSLGITKDGDSLPARIERICKTLARNDFDDDMKSLLIIELRQLQSELDDTTEPQEQHSAGKSSMDWDRILKAINLSNH